LNVIGGVAGERAGAADRATRDLERADRLREPVEVQTPPDTVLTSARQTPGQRHRSRSGLVQTDAAAQADADGAASEIVRGIARKRAGAGDRAAGELERADRLGQCVDIQVPPGIV